MSMEKKLPTGWEVKRLENICEILDSKRKPITKKDRISGSYPYYGATGILDYVDGYIFEEELILLGEDGAKWEAGENSAFIATGKYWVNNHAHIFKPNVKLAENNWIVHYLNFSDLTKYISGMTVPKLTQEKMRSIEIPLPPLSEQKRIVAILDEAFQAIDRAKENAGKNLANAREVFDSYLNQVFSNPGKDWEEKIISDISENLDYKRIPITKRIRDNGDIPYYGASGIVDYVKDFIFDEDLLCISEDGANLLARTYPIAFSISGKTWVNNHAHIMRFKNIQTQKFVEFYFNTIRIDDYVSGMAQPKLNQAMLNSIPIPYPPLQEQSRIVYQFDKISEETHRLESIYQQKLAALDELKKSILQKAFSGEL